MFLLSIVVFASCSSDNSTDVQSPNVSDKLLTSITSTYDGQDALVEYTYDSDNHLLSIVVHQLGGWINRIFYEYENSKPVRTYNHNGDTIYDVKEILYEGDRISEVLSLDSSTEEINGKYVYVYENDQLTEVKSFSFTDGVFQYSSSVFTEYQNGEIYKLYNSIYNYYHIYEYDDKHNPFYNVNNYNLIRQIEIATSSYSGVTNNVLKVSTYSQDTDELEYEYTQSYEYDSDDFLAFRHDAFPNQEPYTLSYNYSQ
ncbi:MAG: hypothetical protein ACSHXF_13665 [Aquaticitalea sp.]